MFNVHTAKTQLSKLLEKVQKGEHVVIAKGGKPVAVLTQYQQTGKKRKAGKWKEKVKISPDFNEFDSELEQMFGLD